jgi:hypothetical protein
MEMTAMSRDFHSALAPEHHGAGRMVSGFDVERVPVSCDGCGRDSLAAGMLRTGWTIRPAVAGFAGSYCGSCAAALQDLDLTLQCVQCGREVDEDGTESQSWRYWPNGLTGLHPFCPGCARRELHSR